MDPLFINYERGEGGFVTEITLREIETPILTCKMGKILEVFLRLLQRRYFKPEDTEFIRQVFSHFQKARHLLLILYALEREDLNLYLSEVFVVALHCEKDHQEKFYRLLEEISEQETNKSTAVWDERELERKRRKEMELKKLFLEGLVNYMNYLVQLRENNQHGTTKSEFEIENSIVKALKRDENFCMDSHALCSKGCSLTLLKIVECSPSTGGYHVYAFLDDPKKRKGWDHFEKLKMHLNEAILRVMNEKHAQGISSMVSGVKFWIKTFFAEHLSVHKKSYFRDGITKAECGSFVLHNPSEKLMHILAFTLDYGI